ncbi:MAG: hypothetical protein A3F54_00835 [Candidatus Kerfeldbacteria bacterium RIFCSPHIGHO2_12_FULL_48_17]|uniref:Uncharacterized protein n=1 Tax=Candidatus Kerfeldbacteria bacterium RIFCSPHIGHO2_12_FULL_48_17 TaxID=1798542 RepID=A0A1G2B4G5_9BACT|nr:MAG: hypothetical protein A3F54_00835 [Candidatus Kerfeldbacteria bacterium RIFCSPHIGHO2_12_FULL_48_17]
MHSTRNENVTGDYLLNCKNAQQCFMSQDLEDCSYCQLILFGASKDSYDISIAVGERCYEIQEAGGYNVQFSWRNMPKNLATGAINLDNLQYTVHCSNVSDLFACVGMRNARYCIFNKQYSKEEYFALRTKIIEHMKEMPYTDAHGRTYSYGEFFPPELSPFAYNETIAQEYFPLTKAEALAQGYRWRDEDHKTYSTTLRAADLPDTPATAAANMRQLTKDTITCAHQGTCTHQCTGAYRIIEAELAFYQRLKLPLPHLCPNCRHYGRLAQRNPIALYPRQCTCTLAGHNSHTANTQCPTTFQTSYAPNRPEKIYCEYCYQKEIL